jgi:hypothetical protein
VSYDNRDKVRLRPREVVQREALGSDPIATREPKGPPKPDHRHDSGFDDGRDE